MAITSVPAFIREKSSDDVTSRMISTRHVLSGTLMSFVEVFVDDRNEAVFEPS